jgi:hypothetical protein
MCIIKEVISTTAPAHPQQQRLQMQVRFKRSFGMVSGIVNAELVAAGLWFDVVIDLKMGKYSDKLFITRRWRCCQ